MVHVRHVIDDSATAEQRPGRPGGTFGLLVGSCHPMPTVAVTIFATALAIKAGNDAATCAVLALAIFAGQLSIGWSNDRLDAARDRSAGRTDKPLATDAGALRLIDRVIAVDLVVTVAASLALGWWAGLLHLGAVGCGWLYNAGLKGTALSFLPYAIAFGSLPAIATLALPDPQPPTAWAVIAGALLGVTAHLTNTLPDLLADRDQGVWGFPHRVGARPSLLIATLALLAGSAVLVLAPAGSPSVLRIVGLALVAAWTVVGSIGGWRRPDARWLFAGTVAVVALDIALLMLGPTFTT